MLAALARLTYHRHVHWMATLLALAQALAAARVLPRFLKAAAAKRVAPVGGATAAVSVIVPVLNEEARLGPCLEGLCAHGEEVAEILVVDGGSTDGTRRVVAAFAADPRVRLLDAAPVPADWNGKAWGLEVGRRAAQASWLLCIDADVRPTRGLASAVVALAERERVAMLSVALEQRLAGWADALVHPAFLTTLVYRFGPPGSVATTVSEAHANGQCLLVHRQTLAELAGFRAVRGSRCEDVTLARLFVSAGERVGIYEAPGLAWVQMHDSARAIWANWPRSLPLVDRFGLGLATRRLLETTLVQALPLLILPVAVRGRAPSTRALAVLNLILVLARLGVLVGTARAYPGRPWTYWLSPLADGPALLAIWFSLFRRRHRWRGRILVEGAA